MTWQPPVVPPPGHKILGLVVHGVGEQAEGSTLRSIVKNFYPLVRERIDPTASIDVKPLDAEGVPQVRIAFEASPGGDRYELLVREVHWAQAFAEPSFGGVIAGVIKLLTTWLRRVRPQDGSPPGRFFWFARRLLARTAVNIAAVALMMALALPFLPLAIVAILGGWNGRLRRPPRWFRWLIGRYADFQPRVVELAIVVLLPVIIVAFGALVIVESLGPLRELLPDAVAKARRWLSKIATAHLGDVWMYAGQPWEASQIRSRFERRFRAILKEEGAGAEAMFVIAHSLGCPVTYEGLSGRRMREFIAGNFGDGKRDLYYFTVGSALPAIWRVVPEEEKGRLHRELPGEVHWEDFISPYDPVQFDLICKEPIKIKEIDDKVSRPTPSHPVLNQMDMLSEHTSYWNNAEQVVAPILDTITRRRFQDRLKLSSAPPAAPEGKRRDREYRMHVLAAWKAVAWLTVPAVYIAIAVAGVGQRISGWAERGFLDGELWEGFALTPVLWALVAAVIAVGIYSTVIKWFWDAWDKRVKYVVVEEPSVAERRTEAPAS